MRRAVRVLAVCRTNRRGQSYTEGPEHRLYKETKFREIAAAVKKAEGKLAVLIAHGGSPPWAWVISADDLVLTDEQKKNSSRIYRV